MDYTLIVNTKITDPETKGVRDESNIATGRYTI